MKIYINLGPVCPGRNGLPVSAVRDGGKFKECEKSSDCSGDDYCAIQQNVCCPKPGNVKKH